MTAVQRALMVVAVVGVVISLVIAMVAFLREDAADDRERDLRIESQNARIEHRTESERLQDEIEEREADDAFMRDLCERLRVAPENCLN